MLGDKSWEIAHGYNENSGAKTPGKAANTNAEPRSDFEELARGYASDMEVDDYERPQRQREISEGEAWREIMSDPHFRRQVAGL